MKTFVIMGLRGALICLALVVFLPPLVAQPDRIRAIRRNLAYFVGFIVVWRLSHLHHSPSLVKCQCLSLFRLILNSLASCIVNFGEQLSKTEE